MCWDYERARGVFWFESRWRKGGICSCGRFFSVSGVFMEKGIMWFTFGSGEFWVSLGSVRWVGVRGVGGE